MPRCRPGDLAVVIRGENSGAFVGVDCRENSVVEVAWECTTRSPVSAELIDPTGRPVMECILPPGSKCCFFDVDLQPIRPLPEKVTREDEVTA